MYSNISTQNFSPYVKGSLRKLNRILPMLLFFAVVSISANAQIKISDGSITGNANPSAILDLQSNGRGLLLPRVELTSITSPAPLSAGTLVAGMMVYNTATVGTAITPGYYVSTGKAVDGVNVIWEKNSNVNVGTLTQKTITYYDDTTGLYPAVTGAPKFPTISYSGGSYGQGTYPQSGGRPTGTVTILPTNDTIKKLGVGIYKITFYKPFKDNNYYPAVAASNGLYYIGNDNNWTTVCSVPYMATWNSNLFAAAVSEEGKGLFYTNYANQGGTGQGFLSIITKTKNYCYVTVHENGSTPVSAAYLSLIFFAP